MKFWWLTDYARVRAEKTAVEQIAADEGWFQLSGWRMHKFRFSANGVIIAHGIEYPIRLIYPDQFPSVPAWVEPQDSNARWSSHQYGKGGLLCLELRPDNWSPEASGADVLRSAYNLLDLENPLGEGGHGAVPSADQIGDVQSYEWGSESVLISSGCLKRIRDGAAVGVRALRWTPEDNVWPLLVFDAIDCLQPQHLASSDLDTFWQELPVVIAQSSMSDSTPENRAALALTLNTDLSDEFLDDAIVIITICEDGVKPIHSPNKDSVFVRKWVVLPEDGGSRTGRKTEGRSKSVALAGLGSAGSKIAEMLLRSGVHRLVLIDGDVMLPGNLERHTLDWRDVGFRKAKAVKRRLKSIVPGASIHVIPANLNWQRSAKTHADQLETIAECDLIVDATGDVPTALLLGAIAAENKKPFISTEVFEGGLGCLVARSIPERDPPYTIGRSAYVAYCDQRNVEPPTSGHRAYEALTEASEPLVADDAAVTIAAAHTARVILDVLDQQIGATDNAWLLFGFREGWLFKHHGYNISLDVGPEPPRPPIVDDIEMQTFVSALAKEVLDATAPSP